MHMTLWIVGGLVVLVVAGITWARVRAARSERRSMETYGHGLAALGDVARRSGPSASVRVLPRAEAGRAHVRADTSGQDEARGGGGAPTPRADRPGTDARRPVPGRAAAESEPAAAGAARRPDELPEGREPMPAARPAVSIPLPEGELSFGDGGEEAIGAGAAPVMAARPRPSVSPDGRRRRGARRKATVASFAAVAVLLILTAAVLLSLQGGTHTTRRAVTHPSLPSGVSTSPTRVTTTTVPMVTPISRSGDDATFNVPPGRYTLVFSAATGACWIGIETALNSGTYLWSETVQAGHSQSYSASGPLAVQLGAPEYVSVTLNGVPVKIPRDVTYYALVFASS